MTGVERAAELYAIVLAGPDPVGPLMLFGPAGRWHCWATSRADTAAAVQALQLELGRNMNCCFAEVNAELTSRHLTEHGLDRKGGIPVSCDYAVWHTKSRLTDAEALELYARLCDGDPSGVSPSHTIPAFYAELTSIHPEIDSIPEDKIDDLDLCPWSIAFDRSDGHLIMSCAWSRADYVGDLVRRLARKHNLACFDPQAGTITHPDTLTLTADGERKRRSPSLADLKALVDRMVSGKGPSFAILEGRGDDYVQAFGAGNAFAVEWREHAGDSYRHWKAGTYGPASSNIVSIVAGDSKLSVESNERLDAPDVVAILEAYLTGCSRPKQYQWRDMTGMFRD